MSERDFPAPEAECRVADSVATGSWRAVWAVCSKPIGHVAKGDRIHRDNSISVEWED